MSSADEKAYMPNVLWFESDGGAEKYTEHASAASPFVAEFGGVMIDAFRQEPAVIGEWETDFFFTVERPNSDAFLMLPQNPEYRQITHLRDEALPSEPSACF